MKPKWKYDAAAKQWIMYFPFSTLTLIAYQIDKYADEHANEWAGWGYFDIPGEFPFDVKGYFKNISDMKKLLMKEGKIQLKKYFKKQREAIMDEMKALKEKL